MRRASAGPESPTSATLADRLLTRAQAAEYLGISLRTLTELLARGSFPKYRVASTAVRVRKSDLDTYIRSVRE